MSTLADGLLSDVSAAATSSPRLQELAAASVESRDGVGPPPDGSALQAAPWPETGETDRGEQELVPFTSSALYQIELGVDGPSTCTRQIWLATFAVGMLGGAWAGLTLVTHLHMPISGGWFSCVCIMFIELFHKTLRLVRAETGEGGQVAQLLRSNASPQCANSVRRIVTAMRVCQAAFCTTQIMAYGYMLLYTLDADWMRPDIELSMLAFFGGFVVGSFMLNSMLLSIMCSCEVLDDRTKRLTKRAEAATTAQSLYGLSLALRELDHEVQQAVVALRPIVLTVRRRPTVPPLASVLTAAV
jgi:hypothetical protein